MGFFVILIIAGIIIFFSVQNTQQAKEKWRAAADNLHLSFVPGGMGKVGTIQGSRNGHRVRVSTYTKGSGNSSKTYTRYLVEYRDRVPFDLKMTRQGAMFAIKQAFGYEDVEIGDPAFDSKVVVRSAQPNKVREFLTPDLRDKIRLLIGTYPTIEISNEQVVLNKSGRDVDSAVIGHCVRRLVVFSESMVERGQGKAAPAAESAPEPPPLYEIKEDPSAAPILSTESPADKYVPPIPEPKVVRLDHNPLDTARPVEPPPPPPAEPVEEIEPESPAAPEAPAVPEDLRAVAEVLYGADAGPSFAANAVFDERFENRSVTGQGVLKRVGKFSYDPVFKEMRGVKATFEVCQIAGAYSKVRVKAEVAYPPERFDALKAREGASLPINGKLIAQDAMMNQLYVLAD